MLDQVHFKKNLQGLDQPTLFLTFFEKKLQQLDQVPNQMDRALVNKVLLSSD